MYLDYAVTYLPGLYRHSPNVRRIRIAATKSARDVEHELHRASHLEVMTGLAPAYSVG